MARRKLTPAERLLREEQPIAWGRSFVVGAMTATMMVGFIDIFNMMELTPFSYEVYLGSLARGSPIGQHNWTIGMLLNWVVGGLFGTFYAYCFEFVFKRSGPREGMIVGLWHTVLAAVAFFPFFNVAHEQMGVNLYPRFGILGSSLDWGTPVLLTVGHLIFGATMGTLYGPVRLQRARLRMSEPGELARPGDRSRIRADEDPEDTGAMAM